MTTDGTTPTVKKNKVTNGEVFYNGEDFVLEEFAGKTVTIKARALSASGTLSKVATLKVKVAHMIPDSVHITGTQQLIAGKSATYKAHVYSEDYEDYSGNEIDYSQKVTWSIVYKDEGVKGAKISSSGKLTTKSSDVGLVVIRATSTEDDTVSSDYPIGIVKLSPIETIKLSKTKLTAYAGNYVSDPIQITKLVNAKGKNVLENTDYEVSWSSSNENIVYVTNMGRQAYLNPLAKGTAKITATVAGKSVTCTVTVKQAVEDVTINGSYSIGLGKSLTYKASVYPKNASNKNVTWSLDGSYTGVSISSKGVLKVTTKATVGTVVGIRATAKDKQGAHDTVYVTIVNPIKSIKIYDDYNYYDIPGAEKLNDDNTVKEVLLYSSDFLDAYWSDAARPGQYWNDTRLYAEINPTGAVEWTSSNESVVYVDSTGHMYGIGAGNATVTCKATDGSGKKATVMVKVITPTSSITLSTNRNRFYYSNYFIAYGKTAKHKVTYGDTFGKPSVRKVKWTFEVYADGGSTDITSTVKAKGLVKLSSTGKLTVKKGMSKYYSGIGSLWIVVTATAKDGTGCYDTIEYIVTQPTSKMGKVEVSPTQYLPDGQEYKYVVIRTKSTIPPTVKSSNAKVASYVDCEPAVDYYNGYYYHVFYFASNAPGTAYLTFRYNDGSTKTLKVKVKF